MPTHIAPVFRFAPSPNGELHLGHALSALTCHEMALRMHGRFLLRIEDIDTARCKDSYVQQIYEDLAWLDLRWKRPVLRQSTRFDAYDKSIKHLQALGVLYRCFATRSQIAAAVADLKEPPLRDPDGAPVYPGLHRNLSAAQTDAFLGAGKPFALRLDLAKALRTVSRMSDKPLSYSAFDLQPDGTCISQDVIAKPERWGDAVIKRKDTPTSYHLAVVVDDAFQDVTHVVRGQDLEAATDLHCLLQRLLGLPTPRYHHHRLLTAEDGRKLAKSEGDKSLKSLRDSGVSAHEIRNWIGTSSGGQTSSDRLE